MKHLPAHFFIVICSLLLFLSVTTDQEPKAKYPTNYFRLPLEDGKELLLAGTFGELRPNHFHSGIDIKTEGVENANLVAVADGYVSRIKVDAYGYGRTLYVDHPNGFTSVYAHLNAYSPTIEKFVQKIQKEQQSWTLEVFPGKNELKVKKGELVAISGNTGASRAPHLHFEIRDSKTQTPIDPLLFGYILNDNISPRVYGAFVYPIGDSSMVRVVYSNGKTSTSTGKPLNLRITGSSGNYKLRYIKEIQANGKIGFSFKTYDYQDGSHNKLGVPLIELKGDGKTFFKQDLERLPFTDTRYLNALIDYEVKAQYGSYYNRAYVLPGNKLDVYRGSENGGVIELKKDTVLDMIAEFKDRTGNSCELSFTLKGLKEYEYPSEVLKGSGDAIFRHNQMNKYETDEIKLEFPEGCFYDDLAFRYDYSESGSYKYSLKHSIHTTETPIHKYYKVSVKAKNIPEKYQSKAVITRNGRSEGGFYSNGWVSSRARYFGTFGIGIDTIAPRIVPYKISGYNLTWRKSIAIGIGDNLSGLKSYKAFIDGEFVIMEHDYKAGVLRYNFTAKPDGKVHTLKILAVDRVGNKNEVELKYTR